jgi:hypothetical protein
MDEAVEQAVGEDLGAQVLEALAGIETEEMVPLQQLVQQDAVEKAAERQADGEGGAGDAGGCLGGPGWRGAGASIGLPRALAMSG